MNILQSKTKEVSQSLIPIVIFVAVLGLTFIPIDIPVMQRFFVGAFLVFAGLSIFLWGVDQSMEPIGYHMAREIATSRSLIKTILLSFALGFLITIAEPDILILGDQVESASGGTLDAGFLVTMISVGVGVLISIASIRILSNFKYNVMMTLVYLVILVLGTQVSEEFLAISFDASGATTGALTTPFVLAISIGLSRTKGGKTAEEDSFGMVGAMSAGPILAVMLISVLTGQQHIHGETTEFVTSTEVWAPIFSALQNTLIESLKALALIAGLFFIFNFFKFKVKRKEMVRIIRGLIYTIIGLTLFLVGANEGFMDMGRILGTGLADRYFEMLPVLGLALGMMVVLAEPAVHVLGEQVEDVTAGNIPVKVLKGTLSIGVGIAIALSMVKIMSPQVQLWFFLLPGFAIAIALSYFVDPIFVGIAFDAGGVASGPMSATFVLAFAQGVADSIPTADVLRDGFGIIAMIAMTPVLSIMVLGSINKIQTMRSKHPVQEVTPTDQKEICAIAADQISGEHKDLIFCVVERGYTEEVIALARSAGSTGATILHGRDARSGTWLSKSMRLQPEKEVLWLLVDADITLKVSQTLLDASDQQGSHIVAIYALPVTDADGLTADEDLFQASVEK